MKIFHCYVTFSTILDENFKECPTQLSLLWEKTSVCGIMKYYDCNKLVVLCLY